MENDNLEHSSWFHTRQIESDIYLTTEDHYYSSNRANIWFICGTERDVVIDTGLGVCNLKKHFEKIGLIKTNRECIVICTHAHFDHSGGAHHFDKVLIHEGDYDGLRNGEQTATLNWSHSSHYHEPPYTAFRAEEYKVPPTQCEKILDGHRINLGGGDDDEVEIKNVPGHTPGSIICYYRRRKALFTGDFVYDCENGRYLFDWAPTSSKIDYIKSAKQMIDWLYQHDIDKVYPGHYEIITPRRAQQLLEHYVQSKE